ncbi:MAG: DUF4249 domain-containing protein [Bacteroidota bacterium]
MRLQTGYKLLIFGLAVLIVPACTEDIEIDLNSSDPEIVIEGGVATAGEPVKLKITKSVNFDEDNVFPLVENATVEISDDLGNSVLVPETAPGIYSTDEFSVIEGLTYHMLVEAEDQSFSASSTIPHQVAFDELIVRKTEGGAAGGPGGFGSLTNYDVLVRYTDPTDEANRYRFVELVNGQPEADYIFDDRLTDGLSVEQGLMRFDRVLEAGDTLHIVMQCIDERVYDYFNSFGNLMGGPGNSSTPANPYTNIDGAVLGYFSAHTYEMKQKIIE